MKMTQERKEYLKDYKKANLKRIPLEVPSEMYIRMLQYTGLRRESMNGFIKRAIEYTIRNDPADNPNDEKVSSFREKISALSKNQDVK